MNLGPSLLFFALAVPALAEAADPPARVAQLGYVEGQVSFQGAEASATSALPDRPLMIGDRLATEYGGRAELAFGNATVRLAERSELSVIDLDETTVRIELATGTASVYLRELLENETFEIVTPNAAFALDGPGEYRVDVNADDASAITVRAGAAEVSTAGNAVRVAAGQRVRFDGRDAYARLEPALPADAFDDWVLERELRLAEAEPSFTPYEGESYDELDRHGEWYDEPRYGRVWMPSYGYSSWSPYRSGYWQRAGYGWSWYDPSPWGFYSFHSGRWAYLNDRNRWCWVPGPRFRERHFSDSDTRPYGWPRVRARGRVEQEDAPRTAGSVATRPFDVVRHPTPRPEVASSDKRQGGTFVPGGRRNPSPPSQPVAPSQPAAEAPRSGNETTRSAPAPEARSPQRSERATPANRPFGSPLTKEP